MRWFASLLTPRNKHKTVSNQQTTTKLTLELTRDQHQALHDANPELVKAPEPEPEPERLILHTATGRSLQLTKLPGEIALHSAFCRFFTPRQARELARALIVGAGELEGREPVAFQRDFCPDTEWNESYTLHHLDTLLKITI